MAKLGFDDLQIYPADLEQQVLVSLPVDGFSSPDPLSVDGTLAGRAYLKRTHRLLRWVTPWPAEELRSLPHPSPRCEPA